MLVLLRILRLLAVMNRKLNLLLRKVDDLMSTFQEVSDALDSIQAGVNDLETAIADLKAQVAAGHVVTQEELDVLGAKAAAINTDLADKSDQG